MGGADVEPLYGIDASLDEEMGRAPQKNATVRTYRHRTTLDVAAYAEGRAPEAADEVALDRVFASHRGIEVGGTVTLSGHALKVVGIMTLPDQQALFEDNSDFTLNTITFGVAEVADAGFDALAQDVEPTYTYAILFHDRGLSVAERTDAEADVMEALADEGARVSDFIDADANQGIGYAADDVEGDSSMWEVMMGIIVVIMAFVFVVLTSSTIEEESAVIGTLLASGWRARELVAHYLALPAIVGALACASGTALGMTLLETPMKNLYYNSYSLPPYHMTWSWHAFLMCTVVPFVLLVGVTIAGLLRKMGKTPLQFLRHELGRGGTKSDLNVYLDLDTFNVLFGNPSGYFNAYASNEPLSIDERWLASDLTSADMDKIGAQMTDSMGDMMYMLTGVAVFIFLVFIYLLTKAVIDRSARSISYMKVFGYRDREVSHLYVRSITWCVVASLVLSLPVIIGSLTVIFKAMLLSYNGNIEIFVPADAMAKCVLTGLVTYAVVALVHLRSIRRVPMALALKVQE